MNLINLFIHIRTIPNNMITSPKSCLAGPSSPAAILHTVKKLEVGQASIILFIWMESFSTINIRKVS